MDIITQVNREDEEEDAQLNAYTNDKGKNWEIWRVSFFMRKNRC